MPDHPPHLDYHLCARPARPRSRDRTVAEDAAVNSLPGVTKIRYVASTLLTELEGFSGEEVGEGASELVFSQARAQAYLGTYGAGISTSRRS